MKTTTLRNFFIASFLIWTILLAINIYLIW